MTMHATTLTIPPTSFNPILQVEKVLGLKRGQVAKVACVVHREVEEVIELYGYVDS